jgi:hypothetical protein
MHQRDRIRKALEEAGVVRNADGKLKRLLAEVDQRPAMCWPEAAVEVRARYPEYKVKLAWILWNTGDKLLRLNMIRHSDPRVADEYENLVRVIEECDPVRDLVELQAIVALGDKRLVEIVAKKPGSPRALSDIVQATLHPGGIDKPRKKKRPDRNPR